MSAWLRNEVNGHWTLDAPARARRPQGDGACAFCPGAESRTPPTLDQEPGKGPWSARAFANAFPILDPHEVIVDTPEHVATFAELTLPHARAAVRLWARRMRAARAQGATPLLFRNDGTAAGASVPHAHAQLIASRDVFPRLAQEVDVFTKSSPFAAPGFFRHRMDADGWTVAQPRASRFAGETWILPADEAPRFEDLRPPQHEAFAAMLLGVTQELVKKGLAAHNLVLHTAPEGAKRFHTHAEILPRRDGIGGFELGAGVFVNPGP